MVEDRSFFDLDFIVPCSGYLWVEETKPAGPGEAAGLRLTPARTPDEKGLLTKRGSPFADHSGLFLDFARVEPSSDKIAEFALRFGDLKAPPINRFEAPERKPSRLPAGCTLEEWRTEILTLRAVVNIWQMIESKAIKGLSHHLRLLEEGRGQVSIFFDSHPALKPGTQPSPPDFRMTVTVPSQDLPFYLWFSLREDDPVTPGFCFIQWTINQRLKTLVEAVARGTQKNPRPRVTAVPTCLLGGLWLQFADAVDRRKTYRPCEECGKHFVFSPETARTNRVFCSEACKSRNYRQRKKARELFAQGTSVKKIAKEIVCDVDKVKSWVKPEKEE